MRKLVDQVFALFKNYLLTLSKLVLLSLINTDSNSILINELPHLVVTHHLWPCLKKRLSISLIYLLCHVS
jgi:hypothetical protein